MPYENVKLDVRICTKIESESHIPPAIHLPTIQFDSIKKIVKYSSQNGEEHLLVSLSDLKLLKYIDVIKENLNQEMKKAMSFHSGFNLENLERCFLKILAYICETPPCLDNTETNLTSFYASHCQGVMLGELIDLKLLICRERSMILHLLLTEYGFANYIIYGRKKDTQGRKIKSTHEWVVCKCNTSCGEQIYILDPAYGCLSLGKEGDFLMHHFGYNNDLMWFRIAQFPELNPFSIDLFSSKTIASTKKSSIEWE